MEYATTVKISTKDRLSRIRYQVWLKFRFFAFLIEHMTFIEDSSNETIGVDRYARCFYNPQFLQRLDDSELIGVMCHEVLHLALKHPERGQGRDIFVHGTSLFNVAIDILVNYICLKNGFKLPTCGIIPSLDNGGSINYYGYFIDNIEKRCVEEIYDMLKTQMIQNKEKTQKESDGDGSGNESEKDSKEEKERKNRGGFDSHDFSNKPGEGKEGSPDRPGKAGKKLREINWDSIIQVALNQAKQIGQSPAGFGREFDVYQKGFINWRHILSRIVASASPKGYSWTRPDRRFIPFDIYIPHVTGETTKVLFSIDTSGSISKEDLSKYITEIISLAKSFDGVELRILTHDTDVHDDFYVGNGSIEKIKKLVPHGGGGTTHVRLYEYIKEKKYDRGNNILISMTDGFSEYPERPSIDTIFVLAGHYSVQSLPPWKQKVIELL
jgi:predicted metal-dependent peptidase